MNNDNLTRVALRYRAIYLDTNQETNQQVHNLHHGDPTQGIRLSEPVMAFVARLADNGFCVSEPLLHALCHTSADRLAEITRCINEVLGVSLNWTPLVKHWDVPTGETRADHLVTLIANIYGKEAGFRGTTLPCGHLIPDGTFPLERYTGCPFCGKPFTTTSFTYKGQASRLKELRLFTPADMRKLLVSLLTSPTPLDGTQRESLARLLEVLPMPADAQVVMKETAMLVVHTLVRQGRDDEAQPLLTTPADILRYLWFEKTGRVQIVEPRTLISHAAKTHKHKWWQMGDKSNEAAQAMKQKLRLKYDRRECRRVARWLNAVSLSPTQAAEQMNPKRGMWVRMIHALRLGEYSRKDGYSHLARILDVFYRHDYTTYQGRLDDARRSGDAQATLAMLKQRPGLFARCLFSSMLRFGRNTTAEAFNDVADTVPARLLLSLGNSAETYFDTTAERLARPLTGGTYRLEPHKLLALYDDAERHAMVSTVEDIYKQSMQRRFARQHNDASTIYIEPSLYNIPVSIGDRTAAVQDSSCALMGTRFPVEGDAVRLFMQWGKGMPAQALDMDLSCRIAMPDGTVAECAYYSLTCTGAKHSGDIRSIPDQVGTAEYIELSLPELQTAGARYAVFTCNAYSAGTLSPNLVVGWMDSAYPMKVSEETGVAYDPSCVQHCVRISEGNLSKGLVFGVLDINRREVVWLEMPFTAQTLQGADQKSVEALLRRLERKLSVGGLLDIKAASQGLRKVERAEEADERYTYEWALNSAEVSSLLNL